VSEPDLGAVVKVPREVLIGELLGLCDGFFRPMVRASLGFAVLPWLAVHGAGAWSDNRLRIHEMRPSLAREIFLHWPAGRTPSPLAARAIEIAMEVAGEPANGCDQRCWSPCRSGAFLLGVVIWRRFQREPRKPADPAFTTRPAPPPA